jgi:DNA repair exonuclease SbcCD nuclease subunit
MIVAIGDVHGKFDQLISKMETILEGNTGVNFVQLGDFGLGFEQPVQDWNTLNPINELLKQSDSMMYVIRGNHDNPAFWYRGCGYHFSNIKFVPDDSIVIIEDKRCYFAGGAVSIDRTRRRQGIDYWCGETYYERSRQCLECRCHQYHKGDVIDLLFTHDVYHPCSPYTIQNSESVKYFADFDEHLIKDLEISQVIMRGLYEDILRTNPKFTWYHGHYHESHVTNNNEQITHSLSELEFKEVR